MSDVQQTLPTLEKKEASEIVRENLEDAMVRYGGNIQLYYDELFRNVRIPLRESTALSRFCVLKQLHGG